MAFYKKIQMAINKKWYPQSCLVGNPVTIDQIAKRLAAEKKPEKENPANDPISVNYTEAAAQDLTEHLGRSCRIVSGKKKGRLEIEYYGVDDLNDLLDALHTLRRKSGGDK